MGLASGRDTTTCGEYLCPPQVNTTTFNPGKLCNVGFWEAMQEEDWDCVFFHDVNLLPEDDHNLYICDIFPAPVPWPSTSSTTSRSGEGTSCGGTLGQALPICTVQALIPGADDGEDEEAWGKALWMGKTFLLDVGIE